MDKDRLAFDRLRLFKGSDDGSKLIYRDRETKGGRTNKRTDVVRSIVDLSRHGNQQWSSWQRYHR